MRNYKDIIALFALAITLGQFSACTHQTQSSPSLTAPPPAPPEKTGPSPLSRAADTTWNVVSAPARLVNPPPKPKIEPETFEPANVIIMTPASGELESMPDNSAPSTAPATQNH